MVSLLFKISLKGEIDFLKIIKKLPNQPKESQVWVNI